MLRVKLEPTLFVSIAEKNLLTTGSRCALSINQSLDLKQDALYKPLAEEFSSFLLPANTEEDMTQTRIIISHYGGPDELRVVEDECPEPKRGEVRVRVLAAGVSLPDVMMCQGIHPETPRLPFTPGWDLIGEVERLGDGFGYGVVRFCRAVMGSANRDGQGQAD